MKVLVALAQADGQVVARDQLIHLCWEDRIVGDDAINRCVQSLRRVAQLITPTAFEIETIPRVGYALVAAPFRPPSSLLRSKSRVFGLALFLATVALATFLIWNARTRPENMIASVLPVDGGVASRDLSRDLLAKLTTLQAVGGNSIEFVSAAQANRADLLFEISASRDDRRMRANIVLTAGRAGPLLWSADLGGATKSNGDLRQQLAYTAAQVLECALEAYPKRRFILSFNVLKLYLNGCADLADTQPERSSELLQTFRDVIAAAPKFQNAWSKLLIAEADAYLVADDGLGGEQLKRDIEAARALNPELAAAYSAEIDLLPLDSFAERMRLADRSISSNPDDPLSLASRSNVLFAVGRLTDALGDAQRAARLEPLSPRLRELYIGTLADSGRLEAALQELEKAERLWPESNSLAAVRFRLHLRYGDPLVARQLILSGAGPPSWSNFESFIEARVEPTPPNIERAVRDARAYFGRNPYALGHLVQTLSTFHREPELLELLMHSSLVGAAFLTDTMFRPGARRFWRNPDSLAYAKRVNLLHYWRTSGKWPDFCYATDLPYDCKAEARKFSA